MSLLKVAFCGYRDWALKAIDQVKNHSNLENPIIISSKNEFDSVVNTLPDELDLVVFLGWSWILENDFTKKYLCVGVHPSDLPYYRGGSPLQHQILEGLMETKVSLFTLSEKLDAGQVWMKEDMSLKGDSMAQVLDEFSISSVKLLNNFFDQYPNIKPVEQDLSKGSCLKRRHESESRLSRDDLEVLTARELYDFIRCLTKPYPNAFFKDENGDCVYFEEVRFQENN